MAISSSHQQSLPVINSYLSVLSCAAPLEHSCISGLRVRDLSGEWGYHSGLMVKRSIPNTYPARGTLSCNLRFCPLCMRGNLTKTATRAINSKEVSFSESLFRFRETVRYGVVDDGLHLARGLF